MRRRMMALAAMLLVGLPAVGGSGSAQAMSLTGVGAKFGFTSPEHADNALAIGGQMELAPPAGRLRWLPGFQYWKVNGLSDLSLNSDVVYDFERDGLVRPYVGAGLGLNDVGNDRTDHSSTNLGVNLISGLRMPGSGTQPFLETRYTVSDVSHFALLGGVTFPLP